MHISRINSIGLKYNTQLSSVPKKHSSQPVQAQIQPALTPSLEQMQSFVNLSFKGHSTPVHDEVFHIFLYDDESLEMMAKDSPDEFKKNVLTQDEDGNTPIHIAADTNNTSALSIFAEHAPDEFKQAVSIQNDEGLTPVHRAVVKSPVFLWIIGSYDPESFRESIILKDKNGKTPLHEAVLDKNPNSLKVIAKYAPDEFKQAVLMQDEQGYTPVHLADKNKEILEIIAKHAPKEFKQTVSTKDNYGWTPVDYVTRVADFDTPNADDYKVYKENIEAAAFMAENAPEQFGEAISTVHKHWHSVKETTLHSIARKFNSEDLLVLAAKTTPEIFKQLITQKNNDGDTLVHIAAKSPESLKIISESAPKEFKKALLMKDNDGYTPVHSMFRLPESLSLTAELAPDEFKKALFKRNKNGQPPVCLMMEYPSSMQAVYDAAPEEFEKSIRMKTRPGLFMRGASVLELSNQSEELADILEKIRTK